MVELPLWFVMIMCFIVGMAISVLIKIIWENS